MKIINYFKGREVQIIIQICREGVDIGLFILLVPKASYKHFLIPWLKTLGT